MEPAPCTPEAHALLQAAGISPRSAPGEPRGPDDERFSPIAIGHLHDTLRLAHLRLAGSSISPHRR
ncbi:MAG: hypothetical protein ACKOYH_09060 [Cyanobium sp.]